MKIQKSELAQKISKIKSVVPKKGNNPVLQGVLCKDGYLAANNMQIMVKVKLEDMGEDAFVIPAKAFDLICSLPDGEVEIIPEDNDMIMIKAEKIKNRYHTVNPMMFPAAGFWKKEKAMLQSTVLYCWNLLEGYFTQYQLHIQTQH